MRLLDYASSRGTLMSRLGCKHFSGSFASSRFASSLLGASHDVGVIDGTIENYSDIFELHFMWCRYNSDNRSSEETGREESKRCWAEMGGISHKGNPLPRYLDMLVDTVSIRQHFVGYFPINPPKHNDLN
jgi:hypothetical protein